MVLDFDSIQQLSLQSKSLQSDSFESTCQLWIYLLFTTSLARDSHAACFRGKRVVNFSVFEC